MKTTIPKGSSEYPSRWAATSLQAPKKGKSATSLGKPLNTNKNLQIPVLGNYKPPAAIRQFSPSISKPNEGNPHPLPRPYRSPAIVNTPPTVSKTRTQKHKV